MVPEYPSSCAAVRGDQQARKAHAKTAHMRMPFTVLEYEAPARSRARDSTPDVIGRMKPWSARPGQSRGKRGNLWLRPCTGSISPLCQLTSRPEVAKINPLTSKLSISRADAQPGPNDPGSARCPCVKRPVEPCWFWTAWSRSKTAWCTRGPALC